MRRKVTLKELKGRHKEIVRMHTLGATNLAIADELGVTPACVSYTLRSDKAQPYKEAMAAARDASILTVAERIRKLSSDAQDYMTSVLQGDEEALNPALSPHLRVQVARDILDRAGYGAPKKLEARVAHAIITPQDLVQMKEAAKQACRELGMLKEEDDGFPE